MWLFEKACNRARFMTYAAFGILLLTSCSGDSKVVLQEAQVVDRAKILLMSAGAAAVDLFLSAEKSVKSVGYCAMQPNSTDACTSNHSSFVSIPSFTNEKVRSFFKTSKALTLNFNLDYHFIDAGSQMLLRRVQFQARSSNQLFNGQGLDLIQASVMRNELTYLASDHFNGRLAGTENHVAAAQYIVSQLTALGVAPARENNYYQEFTLTVGPLTGQKTSNVVAYFKGNDPQLKDEFVIIGAHLDHAGTLQRGYTCSSGGGNDSICNGADDNGSGSIGLLNVVKGLRSVRDQLKRSVIVIWFSGEEEGLLGSKFYVQNPIFPLRSSVYMINMDMIGNVKQNGNQLGALGGKKSAAAAQHLEKIITKYPSLKVQITDKAGGGSDHVPFMEKGIPGVFFHTGLFGTYHKTSDHPNLIDYDGMQTVSRIAYELVYEVANEPRLRSGVGLVDERASLVSEEEAKQTCHHLMDNPMIQNLGFDFRFSNDGRLPTDMIE